MNRVAIVEAPFNIRNSTLMPRLNDAFCAKWVIDNVDTIEDIEQKDYDCLVLFGDKEKLQRIINESRKDLG
jgi:hypothetical protein|tara:strand:+ start:425 stop:637 length:213 start_codon:yes stop_codon:yes gene_type:complete